MSTIPVRPENAEALYEHYAELAPPSSLLAHIGHTAMFIGYPPDVTFEPGALEEIEAATAAGEQFVLASNHSSDKDQFVFASLTLREKPLRHLIGNTVIPAQAPLFTPAPLRAGVEIMGAIPVFRQKDNNKVEVVTEASLQRHRDVSGLLIDTVARRMERGQHLAIFPEGTRNQQNRHEVQTLKTGLVGMMQKVDSQIAITTVPMAMYYPERLKDDDWQRRETRPHVYIGRPLGRIDSDEWLHQKLHPAMQLCMDGALASIKQRRFGRKVLGEDEMQRLIELTTNKI